jgi:hypothetical protein
MFRRSSLGLGRLTPKCLARVNPGLLVLFMSTSVYFSVHVLRYPPPDGLYWNTLVYDDTQRKRSLLRRITTDIAHENALSGKSVALAVSWVLICDFTINVYVGTPATDDAVKRCQTLV